MDLPKTVRPELALELRAERDGHTHALAGSVFCPRCGWRIGRADSPALCYTKRCSNCRRALAIEVKDARILIITEDDVAEH